MHPIKSDPNAKNAVVVSVNTSPERGPKRAIGRIDMKPGVGVVGDAHSGSGDKEVSLLAAESHERFQPRTSVSLRPGIFGENITTRGIQLTGVRIGDRLRIGDVELEITRKGKKCPAPCAISRHVGECIMPKECVFARVLNEGSIHDGDPIQVEPMTSRPFAMNNE